MGVEKREFISLTGVKVFWRKVEHFAPKYTEETLRV
jgi:hypothetical protein